VLRKIILLGIILVTVGFIIINLIIACPNIALLTAQPNPEIFGK